MSDVTQWLEKLGLEQYAAAFAENDINLELLPELSDVDLKELGVSSLGHRKKLLKANAALSAEAVAIDDRASAEPSFASPQSYTPKHLAEKILTSRGALEGERKQVTVLFADIRGSLELIQGADPEVAHELLDKAIGAMMEAVHRYEGTVNKVLGDGVMALFGAPLAHEDHAVRAAYAALELQRAIGEMAETARRKHGVEVQARVGLHSGEVVVRAIGNDLSMDYDAIGPTVHLAGRMEQLAVPGTVRLTGATLKLAEGFVEVTPLGPVPVKGLDEPVEIYELTGARAGQTRLRAAALRGLTRFVGRGREMAALDEGIARAAEGHGQVVALVGAPGVGKSRLFYEFVNSHRTHGWLVLESTSVSYAKAHPWAPVVDLLRGYFGIEDRDGKRRVAEKVAGKVLMLDAALRPALNPLLALLGAEVDDGAWHDLGAPQRRRLTLDAVRGLLLREAEVQPLVVVFEDLHWIDSETQSVLEGLIESVASSRLLLLVNFRPEYRHDWSGRAFFTQLRVEPLEEAGAEELLSALLGDDAALADLKAALIARAEGTPLYLEECVRTLVETGVLAGERGAYRLEKETTELEMPPTIHAIIAARIDRLAPEAKRLLQCAAVVGKDVPLAVLREVAGGDEEALHRGLGDLQAAEFLYETRLFPDHEYTFKHGLTHEVAAAGLLQAQRRALHLKAGAAMEALYAERTDGLAEPLAEHFEAGEAWDKAAHYLLQASEKAKARFTYAEGLALCVRALAAAEAGGLVEAQVRAHVLRGDLASLTDDLGGANESYRAALEREADPARRQAIENRVHREGVALRDGARIVFHEHGRGDETLVFVNPVIYSGGILQPLVEALCDEFRIVTYFPRGTGTSDPLERPYSVDDHAADLGALIAALDVGPVVGVGISRGGQILFRLAHEHPASLKKIVGVGTPLGQMTEDGAIGRPQQFIERVRSFLEAQDFDGLFRYWAYNIMSEPETGDVAEAFIEACKRVPLETIKSFFDLDPALDVAPILGEIAQPVLVTHGTQDRQVLFEAALYLLERLPTAQLYAFEGRGHLPLFTATAEFCHVLRQFVREGTVPGAEAGPSAAA